MNDHSPPNTDEWMAATFFGRLLALGLIVLTVLLSTVFVLNVVPLLETSLTETAAAFALPRLRLGIGIAASLGIACGIYLCLHGRAVLQRGQCPPSGSLVWRRTRIVRGQSARRIGLGALAGGITAILFCIAILFYFNHVIERLTPVAAETSSVTEPMPYTPEK